jgi:hypothetical protein
MLAQANYYPRPEAPIQGGYVMPFITTQDTFGFYPPITVESNEEPPLHLAITHEGDDSPRQADPTINPQDNVNYISQTLASTSERIQYRPCMRPPSHVMLQIRLNCIIQCTLATFRALDSPSAEVG